MAEESKAAPREDAVAWSNAVGAALKETCPPGWSFIVLMGTNGEGGDAVYLASMDRDSAKAFMDEFRQKINKPGGVGGSFE